MQEVSLSSFDNFNSKLVLLSSSMKPLKIRKKDKQQRDDSLERQTFICRLDGIGIHTVLKLLR